MENYDYKKVWTRKIDKIFFYKGRMKITFTDGETLIGKSAGSGLGTDANGEDVDGVIFDTDNGIGYVLIEDDIEKIEYLDGEPEE